MDIGALGSILIALPLFAPFLTTFTSFRPGMVQFVNGKTALLRKDTYTCGIWERIPVQRGPKLYLATFSCQKLHHYI